MALDLSCKVDFLNPVNSEKVVPRNEAEKQRLGTFLDDFWTFVTEKEDETTSIFRNICKHCKEEFLSGYLFLFWVYDNHLFLQHRELYTERKKVRTENLKRKLEARKQKKEAGRAKKDKILREKKVTQNK